MVKNTLASNNCKSTCEWVCAGVKCGPVHWNQLLKYQPVPELAAKETLPAASSASPRCYRHFQELLSVFVGGCFVSLVSSLCSGGPEYAGSKWFPCLRMSLLLWPGIILGILPLWCRGWTHGPLCLSPVFQKWVKSCAPDATAVTLGECSYKDTSNLANSWNNSKHSKFPWAKVLSFSEYLLFCSWTCMGAAKKEGYSFITEYRPSPRKDQKKLLLKKQKTKNCLLFSLCMRIHWVEHIRLIFFLPLHPPGSAAGLHWVYRYAGEIQLQCFFPHADPLNVQPQQETCLLIHPTHNQFLV